jgi:hypothetical protein
MNVNPHAVSYNWWKHSAVSFVAETKHTHSDIR